MLQTDSMVLGVVSGGARCYDAREIVPLDKPPFTACVGRFSAIEAAVQAGSRLPRSTPRTSACSRR